MSRKLLRINKLLLGRKPPTFCSHFSIAHQTFTTKSRSSSKFTLDYHSSITQNQPHSKIREEYHTRGLSTIHETHTTKTIRDHEDDGILEREGDFEEESLFEDIVCYVIYLILGVIYANFKILPGYTMFLGGSNIIAYS